MLKYTGAFFFKETLFVTSLVVFFLVSGDSAASDSSKWGAADYTWAGDFNGDGRTDIASASGGNVYIKLSTGATFYKNATWTVPNNWGEANYTWVGDFDGDGRTDIASAKNGNVYMHLSTGAAFNNYTWAVPNQWGEANYTWVGDFDGDGRIDIASAKNGNVYMHLSTGNAFRNQTWMVTNSWGAAGYTWTGDFNGDGRTDIGSAKAQSIYMKLSTGTSFTSETWIPENNNFTMVIMSDPQFYWSCRQDKNTTSDYCKNPANQAKSGKTQARETNALQIQTIETIKNNLIDGGYDFEGVIINGDLTEYGDQDNRLDKFRDYYTKKGFNVWPGLGNHDYQNPVNHCGARAWANWNHCAAGMVQYLAGLIRRSPIIDNFDVTKYKKNPGQLEGQRNVTGSLAYSWNIGKFHFVQLNNYPTYSTNFTRGYAVGISSWKIRVPLPNEWLNKDLNPATNPVVMGKKVILNWHKYGDIYTNNPTEKTKLIELLQPYAGAIKAIFVGHFHGWFGHLDNLKFPAITTPIPATATQPAIPVRPAITVPVIYDGSPIYSRFIQTTFDTTFGCIIRTQVINTVTGSPVNAPASNGSSGRLTIDCDYSPTR